MMGGGGAGGSHRQQSPLGIEDLPQEFHSRASPPGARSSQLPAVPDGLPAGGAGTGAAGTAGLSAVAAGKKREASISVDLAEETDNNNDELLDECDRASSHHRPHHPQNHTSSSPSLTGFGVKGPPGGDCKRICLRHQRMVDGGARVDLQKRLEKLPEVDQQTANTIWSLFSSASGSARILTLRGLLTICCPSQLSFLTEELKAECRLDPFAVLPREVALKCMAYLDAMSLGRAAQVSKSWKALADDDLLWRTMCEQHIARKCEKCGWGLPLLEKRRKQISSSSSAAPAAAGASSSSASSSAMALTTSTAQAQFRYENSQHNHTPLPKNLEEALGRASSSSRAKRPRLNGNTGSSSNLHLDNLTILSAPPSPKQAPAGSFQAQQQQAQQNQSPSTQLTRPWKSVYCERLAIARNWARGKCTFKVLQGHTDAITCLQLDDSLHDVPHPVLMTGSWDRTIRIWNAETGACVSVLRGHTRGVRCIQFDSAKLITGGMDSTLRIWSWRTGQCIRTLEGHRDSVISLCFDKHVLASGSADSTIKVWDFNTAECFTLRGHREWVNQVKIWSPESSDCSVSATPTAISSMAASAEAGPSSSSSAVSPMAGKLLFSASDDGTVKVWDLMTRQCVRTLEGHVAQVQCLKILSVTEPATAPAPPTGDETQNTFINPAAESANRNRSQVTAGNAYEGFFEQQQQQQQLGTASTSSSVPAGFVTASELPTVTPNASAFLAAAARPPPDPASLAHLDFGSSPAPMVISGSLDNTLKIWNVEDASCSRTLFGHIEGVWDVDMDRLRIISASHDRTIKIWDRASGRCLHTLVGHRGAVTSVALGDDKIISGSDDCSVRIWSFAKQQ